MPQTKKKPSVPGGPEGCVGTTCDWLFHGKSGFSCTEGTGDCIPAEFLLAFPTTFHDAVLEEASIKMNRIIHRIPANTNGKKLSFVVTNEGIFMAWVDHNAPPPGTKTVTRRSDEKEIKKALKLRSETSKGTTKASKKR